MSLLPGFGVAMGALSGAEEETETTAWVAAVVGDGGSVSSGRRTLVDELIVSLKADGIWSKLDRLWLFAAENTQSALRDIKSASSTTAVNAPTFTADVGYTGASTKYISSDLVLSSATKFLEDDHSIGAWSLKSGTDSGQLFGDNGLNNIYPRYTDNTTYWRPGQNLDESVASTDGSGMWLISRTGNATAALYRNGSSVDTTTNAGAAPPSVEPSFMATSSGSESWTGQVACGVIGGGLTSGEAADLHTHLSTYLTAVGAI